MVSLPASALLAQQEGVEVGDDDLAPGRARSSRSGGTRSRCGSSSRVVGQQHAQPVADGDAGRDDQEGVGEARVLRVGELVQRLPGDQHRHDDRLAAAGRHLERDAGQARVGRLRWPRAAQFSIQASPNFLATSVR